MGAVILVIFAISVLLSEDITGIAPTSASSQYPGNCGTQAGQQNTDTCLINYANSTRNASVCTYIQDENQRLCYLDVALKMQSINTCSLINKGDSFYTQCILMLNQKYESMAECNDLQLFAAQACIYNVSIADNFTNPSACGQLSNLTYQTECKNLNYYKRALGTKNYLLCANLQNTLNATTLYFISSNHTNSTARLINLFYSSSLNMSPQQYCYLNSAVSAHNESICRYLTGPFAGSCTLAIQQYNESLVSVNYTANNMSAACGSYTGYSMSVCDFKYLSQQALVKKNVTYCSLINSSAQQNNCILAFAINSSDSSYCSEITNASIAAVCNFISNYTKNKTASK